MFHNRSGSPPNDPGERNSGPFSEESPDTTEERLTLLEASIPDSAFALDREVYVILIAHPQGRGLGSRYHLVEGTALRIGRSSANEIALPEVASISRRHAKVYLKDSKPVVEDLGSRNGTFVEGVRISEPTELQTGDCFSIGGVHFKILAGKDAEQRYFEAIRDLAIRDPLTGLFNRRFFEEEGSRILRRCLRNRRSLATVMFDVDHFKAINDTYGHPCGDSVLRQTAEVVLARMRQEELLARVGGEEFCALCPESGLTAALALAERLRSAIEQHEYSWQATRLAVTASFGVGAIETGRESLADLIAAADGALYAAKNSGRNRVFACIGGNFLSATDAESRSVE